MKKARILLFISLSLLTFANVNAQKNIKVKIKKGIVYVNKKEYLKIEKINSNKYFISTLDDVEVLSVNIEEYGTGNYLKTINAATGRPYEEMHRYSVLKFLDNKEIGEEFEVDEARLKKLIEMMYDTNIIVDNKISNEKAKRMIEKYSEEVSKRRFLTKN